MTQPAPPKTDRKRASPALVWGGVSVLALAGLVGAGVWAAFFFGVIGENEALQEDLRGIAAQIEPEYIANGAYPTDFDALPDDGDKTFTYVYDVTSESYCVSAAQRLHSYALISGGEPEKGECPEGFGDNTGSTGLVWEAIADIEDLGPSAEDLAYGRGTFVAVGSNRITTSQDGEEWTVQEIPGRWQVVLYADGRFVVLSDVDDDVAISEDGETWEVHEGEGRSSRELFRSVVYGDGQFVALTDEVSFTYEDHARDHVLTSPDGIEWTEQKLGVTSRYDQLSYSDGTYLLFGSFDYDREVTLDNIGDVIESDYVLLTSTDGTEWTRHSSLSAFRAGAIGGNDRAYGAEAYIVPQWSAYAVSKDALEWEYRELVNDGDEHTRWEHITYANGQFLMMGRTRSPSETRFEATAVAISTDGDEWSTQTVFDRMYGTMDALTYGKGCYVALSPPFTVLRSCE